MATSNACGHRRKAAWQQYGKTYSLQHQTNAKRWHGMAEETK